MYRYQWLSALLVGAAGLAVAVGFGCRRGDEPVANEPASPATNLSDESSGPPIDVPAADLKAVADGNNAFAIDLYKKLAEKEPGNLFFSPYSLSSALAMTYAGARG